VEQLLALNHQFYQTFALQFSATRLHLQPGVQYLLAKFPSNANILDLGCGNGELAVTLENSNFKGQYIGCDISANLLNIAKSRVQTEYQYQFLLVDLAAPGWEALLPELSYNLILCFAVLHHLPGMILRRQFLSTIHHLLINNSEKQSAFVFSVWQFLNSPRLRSRIIPWSSIGLNDDDVDIGDYLLDWRQGGQGFRYVHHFSEAELQTLANETGFSVRHSFYSDGQGGKLGLYQVWEAMRV